MLPAFANNLHFSIKPMSTPEQKIFFQLKSAFTKSLPKGRWMLQRIETSTGTGIPDVYCSIANGPQLWLETKTTEYKVSNEQLNWVSSAWLTDTPSFIVTLATPAQNATKTGQINAPYAPLAWLTACSNHAPQANPYPTNPELTAPGQNKAPVKKTRPGLELILLAFDERMRDCSSLGVYLRRFNPPSLLVSEWLVTFR